MATATDATTAPAGASVRRDNDPYVGPRALREGEPLFGREPELLELVDTTIADRIVLLHSPSGAGKTSLLQAGLIPRLRAKGFRVPPKPIRLNQTPPPGSPANRYLFSLLASLDDTLSEKRLLALANSESPGLLDYWKEHLDRVDPAERSKQELWVLDQFEEVLTLDSGDHEAKEFFFNELGKLLRDEKGLWAIFAIREDYLGELSPLAFRIPTRLSNLYRLTLLGPDEAAKAIVGPALEVGVVFEEDAARQLVDNLRKVRGTASDLGTPLGPFVEPVQLQVVCLWLWEKLADAATGTDPDPGRITVDDLSVLGDVVDDALAGYYTKRVTEVAQTTASGFPTPAQAERAIREWFSYRLISAKGVRQPVSKEQSGLPDVAVRGLRDAYLVREDRRGSFTWIELSHDRLVAPVTRSNEAWFKERLSKFQIRLALWIGQDRPDNLLLSGPDLNEGEHWAFANPDKLDDDGRDLLSRSKKRLTGGDAWTYRLLKYLRWAAMVLVGVFAVGCVVLGLLLLYSIEQRNLLKTKTDEILKNEQSLKESNDRIKEKSTEITNQNKKIQAKLEEEIKAASQLEDTAFRARLGQIASRSLLLLPEQPDLSLLLGVEAVRRINERDRQSHSVSAFDPTWGRARVVAFNALLGALQHTPEATAFFYPQGGEVAAVAIHPDGRRAATVNRSGNLVVTDLSKRRTVLGPLRLHPHPNGAACVAYSHDGKTIATGGFDGTVAVVNAETGKESSRFKPGEVVGSVSFVGADKEVLYSAGTKVYRGTVIDGKTTLLAQSATRRIINAFAVSPNGRRIATAGITRQVRFWDLDSGKEDSGAAFYTSQDVTALAFCPDEPRLLAVGVGGSIATASETKVQQQRDIGAKAPDMSVNQVLIWDVTTRRRVGLPLIGHAAEVTSLAFGHKGATLASSGADRSVLVWDLKAELDAARSEGKGATADANGRILPVDAATGRPLARRLDGHRGPVQGVAFASDGHTLVSAGLDGLLILWDLDRTQRLARPLPGYEVAEWAPINLSVSPTGSEMAVGREGLVSRLTFHDVKTNTLIERKLVALGGFGIVNLGYTPDGHVFYATEQNISNTTHFWTTSDWKELPFSLRQNEDVTRLAFSPDGTWLAGLNAYTGATVWAWDPKAAALAVSVKLPNPKSGPWTTLAFSPDGCTLALGDRAGMVSLYGPGETKPFRESRRHLGAVRSLAFGNYGRFLASGGDDNAVVFWDLLHPDAPPEPQSVHRGSVGCLAFDPFGLMLASGGDDGRIVFWDGRTGLPLGPAFVAHGGVSALAFLPDGKRLFSGGPYGIVQSWDVDPDNWVKMACAVANRNLSLREWNDNFEPETFRPTCPDLSDDNPTPVIAADQAQAGLASGEVMMMGDGGEEDEQPSGGGGGGGGGAGRPKGGHASTKKTATAKGHTAALKKGVGHEMMKAEAPRALQSTGAAPLGETPAKGPALMLASRWMPGQTIRVRFLDGSPEDQLKVHRWADEWTRVANLRFAWEDAPLATIRITFDPPDSHWSYLGTNCLLAPRGEPTMCLSNIKSLQERDARRVVLFEFGHALGFVTELKKPDVGITWNTEAVLDDFGKIGWTRDMVYEQLIKPSPAGALVLNTKLDPDSIMTVAIKKEWTLNGVEIRENFDLSDGDKAAARAAYPGGQNVP